MSIPDFQNVMIPVLRVFGDGGEHHVRDVTALIADQLGLTAEGRAELLPSGHETRIHNRVDWAAYYMKQAGLLEGGGRAILVLTPRGRDLLDSGLNRLSSKALEQFPEFLAFKSRSRGPTQHTGIESKSPSLDESPEERLESAWEELRAGLAQELLERMKAVSASFFERLVVDLLVKMGYGGTYADAAEVVGRSGDGGIDGVIKQDRLGLDAVYVQAKRWDGPVGRPVIQAFAGGLDGRQATKGVMITTSPYTTEARAFVEHIPKRIVLIDGQTLARYMMEFGVGVATARTYDVKRVDLDYYEEE